MRNPTVSGLPWIMIFIGIWALPARAATEIPVPAGTLALGPPTTIVEGTANLSAPALGVTATGTVHLAWFAQRGEDTALLTVRMEEAAPSAVVRVDPPGARAGALHQAPGLAVDDGTLYLTWSVSKPAADAPFASDLVLARSADGGRTFTPPVLVNDDGAAIPHGFEHVGTAPDGRVVMAWLDNRGGHHSGAGALFACSEDRGRTITPNLTLDGMACPCCRPTIAAAPGGALWAVWRKTFPGDVRDVVVARSTNGGGSFSKPAVVRDDGWVFPACPHRGPAIGFDRAGRLYVAWYTEGRDGQPRLYLATSDDEGGSFTDPVSLQTSTTSLPDQLRMAVHPDGIVVAVWEEITGVRKQVVLRLSLDRGRTFGPLQLLSEGAKAEYPTVAINAGGFVAVSWKEHAWPNNRVVLRVGSVTRPPTGVPNPAP